MTAVDERETKPCWVLVDPAGRLFDNGDGIPHYPTKAEAQAEADYDYAPIRREHPCTVIPPCGSCTAYLGAFPDSHFDSREAAEKAAEEAGWVLAPEGTTTCGECLADPACREEAAASAGESR